jgi:UrcA family protein
MKSAFNVARPRLACLALAAAGLAMAAAPAQAQDDYYYSSQGGYAPAPNDVPSQPAYSAPGAYAPQYAPQYSQQYAPQAGYAPTGYAADGSYRMDDLTVRAQPRYRGRSSTTGAPIELVTAQRAVTYHDLDLTTAWGVDELNNRVKRAARSACRELDTFHPITAADSPPCYSDAVASAQYQVRDAVGYAQPRW